MNEYLRFLKHFMPTSRKNIEYRSISMGNYLESNTIRVLPFCMTDSMHVLINIIQHIFILLIISYQSSRLTIGFRLLFFFFFFFRFYIQICLSYSLLKVIVFCLYSIRINMQNKNNCQYMNIHDLCIFSFSVEFFYLIINQLIFLQANARNPRGSKVERKNDYLPFPVRLNCSYC